MDALTLSVACILCAPHADQRPVPVTQWQPLIAEASARFGVPEAWIARVIEAESGGWAKQNGKPITSPAGAMGLMQVMPETFREVRRRYGLGADPYDPKTNIEAGTAYMRVLYERYGYPNLFAAYNAGPGRFDAFLRHRQPLPRATIAYLDRVVPGSSVAFEVFGGGRNVLQSRPDRAFTGGIFFVVRQDRAASNPDQSEASNGQSLFVRLSPRSR